MDYNILKQADLFERISQRIPKTADKHPPFTLILGSGFSYGIIPTTAEIVYKDLPWWMWCQRADTIGAKPTNFQANIVTRDDDAAKAEAVAFWKRVHNAQSITSKVKFELDTNGLPTNETIGEAYRFALNPACTPGLNSPHMVRRYFGDTIRRAGNRLNPAHLFLASIIAEKKTRRLFGTIFTSNFDPLLQRSLQLVNAPYFVSDRPETLQDPEDDDVADAVHVIHTHGSIYRYLLLNSPEEIDQYAEENQGKLQAYFRNHAVLIVGYSGWDDAITRALKNVDQFNHNLFWCDRNSDPDKSSLSPDARKILRKNNAFYVPIKDADDLMVQLHQQLIGYDLPRIFREPIEVAREQLDRCELTGYKLPPFRAQGDLLTSDKDVINPSDTRDLGEEIKSIKKRLDEAQLKYMGERNHATRVRKRFSDARDLYFRKKFLDALPHLEYVVEHEHVLDPDERALARFRRGVAYGERRQKGDVKLAIADYTAVIAMPDAPAELRAKARVNRGNAYGQSAQAKDVKLAIADYTAVIDMLDAPAEQQAMARINRGITYGKRGQDGDVELEFADYTAAIEMTNVPAELRAKARIIRGVAYSQRGQAEDLELAINDYSIVIDMLDAPAEQQAVARFNRGSANYRRGYIQRGIEDYTALIDMPDVTAKHLGNALVNRGIAYAKRGQTGDVKLAMADYTAVIDMHDATAELRAMAHFSRGFAYSERSQPWDLNRAIADYTIVIDMLDAPAEQRAMARANRGYAYFNREQFGDLYRAFTDYDTVIAMPDAPAEPRAIAYLNRGVAYSQSGDSEDVTRAIDDYTAVINMTDAPAELLEKARNNLTLLLKPEKLPPKKKRK